MTSGSLDVMDCRSPLRLLILFLLVSTNKICLHGNPVTDVDRHDLRCVNDYLFTINCSLSIAPSVNSSDSNSSYWLTITETYERETFVCNLTGTKGDYFCSVKTSHPMPEDDYYPDTFTDTDSFEIWLCHNPNDGSENCKKLDDEYEPVMNIKPNAPCCLTISHSSSQHHFTWKSTYEEYGPFTALDDNLKYQLHYYKSGDDHNVLSHEINTNSVNYSVDDHNFMPGTEYAARVRTSPNLAFYKGQWSDWSNEVHWETESKRLPSKTFVSRLGKILIPLCVIVPIVLLFCYTPLKKWKRSAFIPTPAPYFHTLYSDCQGDFKSWVVTQENTADVLKAEETLQIDTLTKCAVVEEEEEACQPQFHHQFVEGRAYSNISGPGCGSSLLGIPYAVSTMAPPSSPESSFQSMTLCSQPGSPAEGDSGCWLERDPPWYCNEYCTLSTFQQGSPVSAEHHMSPSTKSCPTGNRLEAITADDVFV